MVSIIILNYNGGLMLGNFLGSIQKFIGKVPEWEILLRDNSDNDQDEKIVKELFSDDPRIRYFKEENKGNFSSMNNEMVRKSNGDILLFMNNDMQARTDFLTPMKNLLAKPNMGVVGAVLVYPDNRIQHCGVAFDKYYRPLNLGRIQFDRNQIDKATFLLHDRYFQAVTGACLMVTKQDFQAVGGFDEDFNWCYDDIDFCMKIRNMLGKDCAVSCDAGLTHIENYTVVKNPTELSPKPGNVEANWHKLMKKWGASICEDLDFYQANYGRVL